MNIKDQFDLTGKIAVVTGASGHLGVSISEALVESGAIVYATGRNKIELKKLQERFPNSIKIITIDITSENSVKECFKKIKDDAGRIDILVNNASHLPVGNLKDISEDEWKLGMDGTINGVFRCTKEVIPIMGGNHQGSIINISSIYGEVSPDPKIYGDSGQNSPPQYGAGKAAINQFSKYCACHLGDSGIRVNTVTPGPFPKNQVNQNQNFMDELKRKIPLGRVGLPHEIKGVIVFLASSASSFVTGENIHVDGGWTSW
jgi:NAD(P)-dependent dehydrogenase (short-subunit alcohol dehydrogenase family)